MIADQRDDPVYAALGHLLHRPLRTISLRRSERNADPSLRGLLEVTVPGDLQRRAASDGGGTPTTGTVGCHHRGAGTQPQHPSEVVEGVVGEFRVLEIGDHGDGAGRLDHVPAAIT